MVTRPALERFLPGSIDCESSSVNLTGQEPTLPRNTATGAPGESMDLATMNSVAPAAALAVNPAANDTSPLTAVPEPAAAEEAGAEPTGAGAGMAAVSVSTGKGGSCRARALLASAGRPRNSYDFASNSQSSALPPPLARRPSKAAIAFPMEPAFPLDPVPMEPAADFAAGLARLPDWLIALANALAAFEAGGAVD